MAGVRFELAMFDMAGTTVDDLIEGIPLMILALIQAFREDDLTVQESQIHKFRGLEKKDAIRSLLQEIGIPSDANRTDRIFHTFSTKLHDNISRLKEIEGASTVFRLLRERGMAVGVGSGFPESVVRDIVSHLNWKDLSYIGSAESVGKGRPSPDMIFDAMRVCNVKDVRRVVKIGDTVADIEEGKNAGCFTVAVLTGTQTRKQLEDAKPDRIINSVREVLEFVK